ncbi:hypothetical protein HNW77_10870 [Komagataeibacter sp. AV436]|uniref:Uncharacterized protein n=1 Tax=Komagataeibacter melomenusus TaxID=2766578 RepID=A0ABX2AEY7_9PROT|nr:hypothetical protein [Komagataeibacter melomenusus]MBV1831236.1 hypothetical protein [Komagataeibacter melomenusus]NPC66888.1 hypothetical protein [Komagataeibacter melomenusus]
MNFPSNSYRYARPVETAPDMSYAVVTALAGADLPGGGHGAGIPFAPERLPLRFTSA